MRPLALALALALVGCSPGLTESERADYIARMEQSLQRCRDMSSLYNEAACTDYNQLKLALIENKRLEDFR